MSRQDWLVIAAWDVAATLGPSRGIISFSDSEEILITDEMGRPWLSASLELQGVESQARCSITYKEGTYCVVVNDSFHVLQRRRYERKAAGLLLGMQFARDSIDSLLFKSRDLREAEMSSFAGFAELDIEHLYSLVQWYPRIHPFLD
jgi:hypothetical protein